MNKIYDCIVIGGGISGLTSAAFLSKKGLSVALFEKNSQFGGFVNSFKRGGYIFEASTHQICLDGESLSSIKRLLGLPNVEFIKSDSLYETILFSPENNKIRYRYTLPTGTDSFRAALKKAFPESSEKVNEFISIIEKSDKDIGILRKVSREPFRYFFDAIFALMLKNNNKLLRNIALKRFPAIADYAGRTYSNMISFIEDPALRWVLSAYSPYTGCGVDDVNGLIMCTMLYKYMEYGPFLIKGGTRTLIDDLKNILLENKGVLFNNTQVNAILTESNRAKGIRTIDGTVYTAKTVVSAINSKDTFFKLIDTKSIDSSYTEKIATDKTSRSAFQIYLGIPHSLIDNRLNTSTSFYDPTLDDRERFELWDSSLSEESRRRTPFVLTVYRNNSINTDKQFSIVIAEFCPMHDWDSLPEELYLQKKENWRNVICEKVESITGIPLRKNADLIFSATPRTLKHYGGMSDGAALGSAIYLNQSFSKRLQPETPIKNLFLAGSYTNYPGVSSNLDSGIATSNIVLKSIR